MKHLLFIIAIICSLTTSSQERGPICNVGCSFIHDDGTPFGDHLHLDGFYLSEPVCGGTFHLDSTNLSDSVIYEITLPFGDSLMYHGTWMNDGWGPCLVLLHPEQLDSVVEILEGTPFPILSSGTYTNEVDYSLSQDAVIRDSCFLKIRATYSNFSTPHFVRVKFLDTPLGIPDPADEMSAITNEISIWLSNENTLAIKADENTLVDLNLYSISGQLVQHTIIEGTQNLDISALPKGCYIARSSAKNGLEARLKFVK